MLRVARAHRPLSSLVCISSLLVGSLMGCGGSEFQEATTDGPDASAGDGGSGGGETGGSAGSETGGSGGGDTGGSGGGDTGGSGGGDTGGSGGGDTGGSGGGDTGGSGGSETGGSGGGSTCPEGTADCDANPDDCETDTWTSLDHCGKCAAPCVGGHNADPICDQGVCGTICLIDWDDCDNNPANGCETNLKKDASHCGICNKVCSPGDHGGPLCLDGMCGFDCEGGWGNCNGSATDGCEASLMSTLTCGSCNNICPQPQNTKALCDGQNCDWECVDGWQDCNAAVVGCESERLVDPLNCSACGNKCFHPTNSIAKCEAGQCSWSCQPGFADCDGIETNGCEKNLMNDRLACGSCDRKCTESDCIQGFCKPIMIAEFQGTPWGIASTDDYVYWTNVGTTGQTNGSVMRASKHSPYTVSYVTQANEIEPRPIVVGALGSVYWGTRNAVRAISGSTGIISTFAASQGRVQDLALGDLGLFWTAEEQAAVRYKAFEANTPTDIATGQSALRGIAFANVAYWATSSSITAGTIAGPLINFAPSQPRPLWVATDGSLVYWTNQNGPLRAQMRGDAGAIIQNIGPTNLQGGGRIAVSSGYVFWAYGEPGALDGKILRIAVSTGEVVELAINQPYPHGIAVDDRFVYWTNVDGRTVQRVDR